MTYINISNLTVPKQDRTKHAIREEIALLTQLAEREAELKAQTISKRQGKQLEERGLKKIYKPLTDEIKQQTQAIVTKEPNKVEQSIGLIPQKYLNRIGKKDCFLSHDGQFYKIKNTPIAIFKDDIILVGGMRIKGSDELWNLITSDYLGSVDKDSADEFIKLVQNIPANWVSYRGNSNRSRLIRQAISPPAKEIEESDNNFLTDIEGDGLTSYEIKMNSLKPCHKLDRIHKERLKQILQLVKW